MQTIKETVVVGMAAAEWVLFRLLGRKRLASRSWQRGLLYVARGIR